VPRVTDEDVPTSTEQTLSARPERAMPLREDGQNQQGGAFRALRHRNFRVFWIGQLISLVGTWAQNLAQGWLIVLLVDPVTRAMLRHGGAAVGASQHSSPGAAAAANLYSGYVNFAGGIPIFIFTLIAGVVADRVDKRRLLLLTQSLLIFSAVCLGVLCALGRIEIWQVLFFAAFSGMAASFDMPTRQSFIVELVGREDLSSAIALNSSIFNAARALGPAVAGLLLAAKVSIGAAFLGNAALSMAVIVGLLMIRVPPPASIGADTPAPVVVHDKSLRGVWVNMREGFAYVAGHPTVRNLVILVGSFGTFAFSFNILIPVFVRYTLLPMASDAEQVRAFGFMETVRGLGALGGALTVAVFSNPRRQRDMLIAGSLLSTVFLLVFALARTLWLAYAMMAIVSFGFVICFANSNTLLQLTVPHGLRGRVMSIYTLMFIGTMPFGSLFAGWLATYITAPTTILLCAAISLATVLVVAFRPGGLRDIQIAPPPDPGLDAG
jgi:MFS family permease